MNETCRNASPLIDGENELSVGTKQILIATFGEYRPTDQSFSLKLWLGAWHFLFTSCCCLNCSLKSRNINTHGRCHSHNNQFRLKDWYGLLHKGLVFTAGTYINFTMMRCMLSGRFKTEIDKLIICEQTMNLLRELPFIWYGEIFKFFTHSQP